MLADMQEKYPTNAAGDKAFAITMWKDWDGGSIENANLLTNWFGQQVKESVLLGNDNTIMPLTDKTEVTTKLFSFSIRPIGWDWLIRTPLLRTGQQPATAR